MRTENVLTPVPEERCDLITICLDLVGSTAMKISLPEAAWIGEERTFANIIRAAVSQYLPDAVMKSNGDGALVFMPSSDHSLEAIQIAIAVQEEIAQLTARIDGAMGASAMAASIAITTGTGYPVNIMDRLDYWGYTVDKAARLCSAASPNGIFIDSATYEATNIRRIRSKVGIALTREPEEYVGEAEKISVKGVPAPVAYREVMWGRQLFGIRSGFVTSSTGTSDNAGSPPVPIRPADNNRMVGTVKYFDPAKSFGFIVADDGEDFFVASSRLVYPEDVEHLTTGKRVAFIAAAAAKEGKARRASAVLVDGTMAEGILSSVPGDRPYGFLRVLHSDGTAIDVWAASVVLPDNAMRNEDFDFQVEVSAKGPKASKVTRAESNASAA